jgi:hypothetical protein
MFLRMLLQYQLLLARSACFLDDVVPELVSPISMHSWYFSLAEIQIGTDTTNYEPHPLTIDTEQ